MAETEGWREVEPLRRAVLFINPRSGGGKAEHAKLAEHAREKSISTIVLEPGQNLETLVAERIAGGVDVLGMAGGDGSLAIVAAAARAHDLPFVCIPAGTRNHFALDVGVARHDLLGALDAFTHGLERRIDVAEVNGRMFLNNVSLGVYGEAVQEPAYRGAKIETMLETAREVLGPSSPLPALRVVDDRGREHSRPVLLLVSNNPYALDLPLVRGTRRSLAGGHLGVVVLDPPHEGPLADAHVWSAASLTLDASAPLPAGVDGEAVTLDSPVRFVIRPKALRVRISRNHPGVSPSGLMSSPLRPVA
jgi:diacylglycerol kinase family enzyme